MEPGYRPPNLPAPGPNALKVVLLGHEQYEKELNTQLNLWLGWEHKSATDFERADVWGAPEGASELKGKMQVCAWNVDSQILLKVPNNIIEAKSSANIFTAIEDYYTRYIQPGMKQMVHAWMFGSYALNSFFESEELPLLVFYVLKSIDKSPWTFANVADLFAANKFYTVWQAAQAAWQDVESGNWGQLEGGHLAGNVLHQALPLRQKLINDRKAAHLASPFHADWVSYDLKLQDRATKLLKFSDNMLDLCLRNPQGWHTDEKFLGGQYILDNLTMLLFATDAMPAAIDKKSYEHPAIFFVYACAGAVAKKPPSTGHILALLRTVDIKTIRLSILATLVWRHKDSWRDRVIMIASGDNVDQAAWDSLRKFPVVYDAKTNTYSAHPFDAREGQIYFRRYSPKDKGPGLAEALFYIHPALKQAQLKTYMNPMRRYAHASLLKPAPEYVVPGEPGFKKQKVSESKALTDSSASDDIQRYLKYPGRNPKKLYGEYGQGQLYVNPATTRAVSNPRIMKHMAGFLGKLDARYRPGQSKQESKDPAALKLVYVGITKREVTELSGIDFNNWIRSGSAPEGAGQFIHKLSLSSWIFGLYALRYHWDSITDVRDRNDYPAMIQDFYLKYIQPGANELKTHVHGWVVNVLDLRYLLSSDNRLFAWHFLKYIDKSPWKFSDLSALWRATGTGFRVQFDAADRVWQAVAAGDWESLAFASMSDFARPLRLRLKNEREQYRSWHSEQQNADYDRRQREEAKQILAFYELFVAAITKNSDNWHSVPELGGGRKILKNLEAFLGDIAGVQDEDRAWASNTNYIIGMCKGAINGEPPTSNQLREYIPTLYDGWLGLMVTLLLWRHADNWPGRILVYGKKPEPTVPKELEALEEFPVVYDAKTNTYTAHPITVKGLLYFAEGEQNRLLKELFWIHPVVRTEQLMAYMNPMRRAIHSHQLSETAKAREVEAAKLENKSDGSGKRQRISSTQSMSVSSGQKSLQHYLIHPLDSKLPNREVDPQVQNDVSTEELMQKMASFLGKPDAKKAAYANLEARVDLKNYATDIPVWVVLYSQRLFRNGCENAAMKNRSKDATSVPPLYLRVRELHPEDSFWVYVYAERRLCPGEKKTCPRYITRVGFTEVKIHQLDLRKSVLSLIDINGHTVGQVTLTVTKATTMNVNPEAVAPPTMPDMDKLVQETERQRKRFSGSNITPKLQHLDRMVVTQHFGSIPMWAFCLLHLPDSEPLESLEYHEQAVENAKYLLGISGEIPNIPSVEAEMLNEMQTLATRGQLYVPDTTKMSMLEANVDDWTSPLVAPEQKLLGLDCEDAALRIVQDAWWWLHAPETGLSPEAQRMSEAEQGYITFFVAMTLKVAGVFSGQSSSAEWVYHAAALKLDRNYVLQKLGIAKKKKPGAEKEWLPAVLLEGTAYTTGCWDYTPVHKAEADKVSFQSQANFSKGDTISKVTPTMMRRKDLYGHILSMFSPELALDYGVVEISLSQDNKLAASAKEVMRYSDQVSWHPIKIQNVQERLEPLKMWAYPPAQEPVVTKVVTYPEPKLCDIDFLLREVDWNSDTQKELEANFGKKLHATQIQIADDLSVWQICSSSA